MPGTDGQLNLDGAILLPNNEIYKRKREMEIQL